MHRSLVMAKGLSLAVAVGMAIGCNAGATVEKAVTSTTPPIVHTNYSEYRQTIWKTEHGLPHDTVQDIVQTRDGYLWLATSAGLARFDGARFRTFTRESNPNMVSDECVALAEDRDGALWIGTTNGLLRFSGGTFQRYTTREGLWRNEATVLCANSTGGVWVGTRAGLNLVQGEAVYRFNVNDGFKDTWITCLDEDPRGTLWVGTRYGLLRREVDSGRFIRDAALNTTSNAIVGAICTAGGDETWVWCSESLFRYREGTWTIFGWRKPYAFTWGRHRFLERDRAGDLWMSAGRYGLERFRDGQFTRYTTNDGLSASYVLCAHADREGNLWLGTDGGGLNRWQSRSVTLLTSREGLVSDSVRCISEARDGSIWVGTAGGLSRVQMTTGSSQQIPPNPSNPSRLTLASSVALNPRITNYGPGHGLVTGSVKAVAETEGGSLYVATEGGLYQFANERFSPCLRPDGIRPESVQALHPAHDEASRTQANASYEDAEGVLWIGLSDGLTRRKDGQSRAITARQGLPQDVINLILEDDAGCLWLGCKRGLYRIRKQDLSDVAEGRTTTLQYVAVDESDGLLSGVEDRLDGCKSRDGRLWFPTERGVAIVDPKHFRVNQVPPPVLIEGVLVDGQDVIEPPSGPGIFRAEFGGPGENPTAGASHDWQPGPRSLQLSAKSRHEIEIRYTANSLVAPEKVRFKYRLDGFDKAWREGGKERVARYLDLPPGQYEFRVIACNNHGVWNQAGAVFGFYAPPMASESWRIFLLSGCGVSLVAVGFHRLRVRRIRRSERGQKEALLVRQREEFARNIHDVLGARLTQLALWNRTGGNGFTPPELNGTAPPTAEAVAAETGRLLDQLIWTVKPENDDLAHLAEYLGLVAREFLAPTGIALRLEFPRPIPPWPLSAKVRQEILLATTEALHNSVKHSRCKTVRLRLTIVDGTFRLTIEDDGCGFQPGETRASGDGLHNIESRMTGIGGRLVLESEFNHGTRVILEVRREASSLP